MQVLNKHNGQVTYVGIQEMAYLDMVVSGGLIEACCIIIRTFKEKHCISTFYFFKLKCLKLNQKFLSR